MTLTFGVTSCPYCRLFHAPGHCVKAGQVAKQIGMALVTAADSVWPARAQAWVASLERGTTFTAEDLCAAIGRPERPNAVGARLSALSRAGLIEVDGFVQASRAQRHASRFIRWRRT